MPRCQTGREALLTRAFSPKGLPQETTFPLAKGSFQLLEALTCRMRLAEASQQVMGLEHMAHKQRLGELGFFSLKKRELKEDLLSTGP